MPPYPADRESAPPANLPLPPTARSADGMAGAIWAIVSGLPHNDRRFLWEEVQRHVDHGVDADGDLSVAQLEVVRSVRRCDQVTGRESSAGVYAQWYEGLDDQSQAVAPTTARRRFGGSWVAVRQTAGHSTAPPLSEASRHRLTANGKAMTRPEAVLVGRLFVLEARDLRVRQANYRSWVHGRIAAHGEVVTRDDLAQAVEATRASDWSVPAWLLDFIEWWPEDRYLPERARLRTTLNLLTNTVFIDKQAFLEAVGVPLAQSGRRLMHAEASPAQTEDLAREAAQWSLTCLGRTLGLSGYRQYCSWVTRQLEEGRPLASVVTAGVLPPSGHVLAQQYGGFHRLLHKVGVITAEDCAHREKVARATALTTSGLSAVHAAATAGHGHAAEYDSFVAHLPPGHPVRRSVHRFSSAELIEAYGSWAAVRDASVARSVRLRNKR